MLSDNLGHEGRQMTRGRGGGGNSCSMSRPKPLLGPGGIGHGGGVIPAHGSGQDRRDHGGRLPRSFFWVVLGGFGCVVWMWE